MKKVLVITYYWPPSGGGGVQRWLKFVKYLPEFGWEPIVFTPENPDFSLQDDSLMKDVDPGLEVIRFPIWEPFGIYKKIFKTSGKTVKQGIVIEKSKLSLADKLSIWVRANLFIPDPRCFWVKPSAKFLESIIIGNEIDVVITTGPPHSLHLIGQRLKKSTGVKWVADFRDPWSDWDVLQKLNISKIAHAIHRRMEKKVMQNCDVLLTVSNRLAQSLQEKHFAENVQVVNNGVDEADFQMGRVIQEKVRFSIVHTGLLNEIRNPESLWDALQELCIEEDGFKGQLELVLAGMVSGSILDFLQQNEQLRNCVTYLDYIPHQKVFDYYESSSVLLLLLNQSENARWILPGKMYEYMFSGKPILTLGEPESDVRDVLLECNAGEVYAFDDKEKIKSFLKSAFDNYKNGTSPLKSEKVKNYTRINLTKKLAGILDTLATKKGGVN
ncbi:glycosyltransferase family 4 protein [Reichenbachiella sp. MALMAid0571]|uniref:glycosyltransferase family 4 protein n=1 Tax=Reichenbachiella sp. MALMAid0571 TaxID=3143939 RepID=UPI0032E01625